MVIQEIFKKPTVKTVIFEIKFSNLFYIESKIGELQLKVIERFPESSLVIQKQFLLTPDNGQDTVESPDCDRKLWEFSSPQKFRFTVTSNSLQIVSEFHKTYNLGDSNRFRDIISFVTEKFFEIIPVPIINRVGLRYIDECPVISKTNETFQQYYNSTFPLQRFRIDDAKEMFFRANVKREDLNIVYMEELKKSGDNYLLILSFDGYANKIQRTDCMSVTDRLHDLISSEYESTIKKPLIDYMQEQ